MTHETANREDLELASRSALTPRWPQRQAVAFAHRILPRRSLRDPRWFIAGAALILALLSLTVFFLLDGDGEDGGPDIVVEEPEALVTISPDGTDVSRLSVIRVAYVEPPSIDDAGALVTISPAIDGIFSWPDEKTLIFQPSFPGLVRGEEYTVAVAADPDSGLIQGLSQSFVTEGLLEILSTIPADGDEEVPVNAQIFVQFSRSIAPLTVLSEQPKDEVVAFDPPLSGRGEWLNTSLYRYLPDELAPSTTYTATVRAGLTSAADGVLQQDVVWTFTTFSPAIDDVLPDNNTPYASPRQPVTVTFNQAMDRASVEAGISVHTSSTETVSTVRGTFQWSAGESVVVFTPSSDLELKTRYQVDIADGLLAANGESKTSRSRTATFTTIGLPGVSSTAPRDGSTSAERYGITITFATPMDNDTVEDAITVSGIESNRLSFWWESERRMRIDASLKASTMYTVTIRDGARGLHGHPMPGYAFSFTTGALSPSVSYAVPGEIGTYASSTEPVLYFRTTNKTSVNFDLYRLTDDEARTILNNGIPKPLPRYCFTPSSQPIRSWTESVDKPLNEVVVNSTSLSGGGPLPIGNYYVASGCGWGEDLMFAVVDTELVLKVSRDELLAWVIDHDTGQPVPGVLLEANPAWTPKDYTGSPRLVSGSATTNADGLASFPLETPVNSWDQGTFIVRADSGGRYGVASNQWQQGAYSWNLGVPFDSYVREYVGHMYTDRPIYRTGETVFFKTVVRVDDDAANIVPSREAEFELTIMDSVGKELLKESVTVNDVGTFAGSFEIPGDGATGDYSVSVTSPVAGETYRNYVAGTSFLVAEFRVPEFEVAVEAGETDYVAGDNIAVAVDASFFFGGPVAGAEVQWTVLSSPSGGLRVDDYEQYSFSYWDYYQPFTSEVPERGTGSGTTAPNGTFAFTVPAELMGDESAQAFQIIAVVSDQSGQAVASSTVVNVHPGAYYAGLLPESYVATVGNETSIDLVTVTNEGEIAPNIPVRVLVYDRIWVTTKEETSEGGRRYRSEPVDTLLATLATTSNEIAEGRVTYTPQNPGTLRFVSEATDEAGRVARASRFMWVAGAGFADWRVTNDDALELQADKDLYQVGETASVLVPAPFEGAIGLVTTERGRIFAREVRDFPSNSEQIAIPIEASSVPNVYVSVVLYRPPTADDPLPRYKIGYVELPVSTELRELDIVIRPDRDIARPGETVRYDIEVTDSVGNGVEAELSVAVVDKAVLSLAEERDEDGLRAFWFQRPLGVSTGSSLALSIDRANDVVVEPEGGGKGGGGLLEDQTRSEFKNTAYWEAQLTIDADGHATVEVVMPDNLTTWRLQARAVNGGTMVGEAVHELFSTKSLLLRPALPRFLRVGDEAVARVLAQNGTGEPLEVRVAFEADGVNVEGPGAITKTVLPDEAATFSWPVLVTEEGSATFTFTATASGGLSDGVAISLPVYLDVTPETTATGGVVIDETRLEALYLPDYAILEGGSLTTKVQPSIAGNPSAELALLAPQPFEGTVRIASRLVATIAAARANAASGIAEDYQSRIQSDVAALIGLQRSSGGWAWCNSCLLTDPVVTAAVLVALGEAKEEGHSIPSLLVTRANSYVNSQIGSVRTRAGRADVNFQAYLLYALSTVETTSELSKMRSLFEQDRSRLTNWGAAYLLLGMSQYPEDVPAGDTQLRALFNDITAATIPSANGNHWEDDRIGGSMHTNERTTALVLEALLAVDPEHPLIEETVRWIVVARGARHYSTDVERAQAILSLSEFGIASGELAGDYDYVAAIDGVTTMSGHFAVGAGEIPVDELSMPLTEFAAGTTSLLSFGREYDDPGRMYYTLDLRYQTPASEVSALNRGMSVSHQYTSLDFPDRPIDSIGLGELVRVTVTVMTDRQLNYLVVDDLLPAGLEPIDPNLSIVDPALIAQLESERTEAVGGDDPGYWAPWYRWYYSPWDHTDIRDDRITLYAQRLPKGVHTFIYFARATTIGEFFVAPAHAEETYFPEVFGRSDSGAFTVTE